DAAGNPVSGLGHLATPGAEERTVAHEVRIEPLDVLVASGRVALRPPVLVKIDVEGHEFAALSGARSLFEAGAAIYFECQREHLERAGTTAEALWGLLGGAGYATLGVGPAGLLRYDALSTSVWNYLALPAALIGEERLISRATLTAVIDAW